MYKRQNVDASSDGIAKVHIDDKLVKLIGPHSIIGRSIVVSEGEDDLGTGGHELSLVNGNCGSGVAWAVIGISSGAVSAGAGK